MIEDKVKEIIINEYGTLSSFAQKIQVPYTTVDTIFKRGFDKSNVTNVIAICKELNLDVESLVDNNEIVFNDLQLKKNVKLNSNNKLDYIIMDNLKVLSEEEKKQLIRIMEAVKNKN